MWHRGPVQLVLEHGGVRVVLARLPDDPDLDNEYLLSGPRRERFLRKVGADDFVLLLPAAPLCRSRSALRGLDWLRGPLPCSAFVLASHPDDHAWYGEIGVPSIDANSALVLDEDVFRITNPGEGGRPYDMVVNSRQEPWKRRHLAAHLTRLAIIEGPAFAADGGAEPGDGVRFRADAARLNYRSPDGRYRVLGAEQVNEALNQSRCGGIFSAIEGYCRASCEYLLAGLPVISTPSLGGRDQLYDAGNSLVVEPTPEAVRAALAEALSRLDDGRFERAAIRAGTLARLERWRGRVCERLQEFCDARGVAIDARYWFATCFKRSFYGELQPYLPPPAASVGARG
jgi:hypothetical protein